MIDKDTPEICAARAADPVWRAEQQAKREEATRRFIAGQIAKGLPATQSKNMRVAG